MNSNEPIEVEEKQLIDKMPLNSLISQRNISNIISKNRIAYLLISFHQGLSSISELAVSYFFKDNLKVEPAELASIMSFVLIPWMIKPLFGIITDLIPIFGYRRKVYIVLCGILNVICWIMMSRFVTTKLEAIATLFLINVGLSFSTVLGEAVVVELSQLDKGDNNASNAKDYVSLFFIFKYIGALASAYLKGSLIDILNLHNVFLITSILPFLLVISGIILIESNLKELHNERQQERDDPNNATNLLKEFFNFITQKYVLIPTIFIILFMSSPSYSDALFYFLTTELKFTPSLLGKISFCTTLTTIIALLLYKCYFKNVDFKIMIIIGTFLSFIFSLCGYLLVLRVNVTLGISDFWFVLLSSSVLSMLGELIMMPMLSLACILCPKNLEGTVYSFFMSAINFGGIMSGLLGSLLTTYFGITSKDYHNLSKLILVSNVLTLVPLPMLLCISSKYFHPEHQPSEEQKRNEVEANNDNKNS